MAGGTFPRAPAHRRSPTLVSGCRPVWFVGERVAQRSKPRTALSSRPTERHESRPSIAAAAGAVGCLSLASGGLFLGLQALSTGGWTETTGIVTDVHGGFLRGTSIRFEDSDRIEHRIRSDYWGPDTREGDAETVRYPPRDPTRAEAAGELSEDRIVGFAFLAVLGPVGGFLALRAMGVTGRTRAQDSAWTSASALRRPRPVR